MRILCRLLSTLSALQTPYTLPQVVQLQLMSQAPNLTIGTYTFAWIQLYIV